MSRQYGERSSRMPDRYENGLTVDSARKRGGFAVLSATEAEPTSLAEIDKEVDDLLDGIDALLAENRSVLAGAAHPEGAHRPSRSEDPEM